MNRVNNQTGYFVFSLDTELAWGYFDLDEPRTRIFSPDGSRERQAINKVLELLDEFQLVGTWALVGHLFYEQCELCKICPVLDWQGKYQSFEQAYETSHPLWYGLDSIEAVLAGRSHHEIAFHGYTHEVFDERRMSQDRARIEIQEWLRLGQRKGIVPETVIFPRDRVGHLNLFKEAGFIGYRSEEDLPLWYRPRYIGGLIKSIDHLLSLSIPPVYELGQIDSSGLVNLRASQHLFGFNRDLEMVLDALSLSNLRLNRIIKGIKKAAREKKVIHIWAHPWEFRTEKDFGKLRHIFSCVAEEVGQGRMRSVGMSDLAKITIAHQADRRHESLEQS